MYKHMFNYPSCQEDRGHRLLAMCRISGLRIVFLFDFCKHLRTLLMGRKWVLRTCCLIMIVKATRLLGIESFTIDPLTCRT